MLIFYNFRLSQSSSNPQGRHVCRIIVHQFASPSWKTINQQDLLKFIIKLRRLCQIAYAVLVISIPAYAFNDIYGLSTDPFIQTIVKIVDCVIEVESFSGTPRQLHPAYTNPPKQSPQYHGLIHIIKFMRQKSLLPAVWKILTMTELRSLAFKVRRKRFKIEPFCLPPDESVQDEGEEKRIAKREEEEKEKEEGEALGIQDTGYLVDSMRRMEVSKHLNPKPNINSIEF